MACSAPSIGLLLSPSIGVGGRTLPSSSSSQSTSAFTPSSQQQHYNISSCFLTTSNKLRLSTVEGFQEGSRLPLKKSTQQTVHVRCEVGTGTVSTSSGTEWVQRTIELPVYKRIVYSVMVRTVHMWRKCSTPSALKSLPTNCPSTISAGEILFNSIRGALRRATVISHKNPSNRKIRNKTHPPKP